MKMHGPSSSSACSTDLRRPPCTELGGGGEPGGTGRHDLQRELDVGPRVCEHIARLIIPSSPFAFLVFHHFPSDPSSTIVSGNDLVVISKWR